MRKKADQSATLASITGFAGNDAIKNDIIARFERLKSRDQLEVLKRIGVGVSEYYPVQKFATC